MFYWLCCIRRKKDKRGGKKQKMGSAISVTSVPQQPQRPQLQAPFSTRPMTQLQQQPMTKKQVPPADSAKQDVSPPPTNSATPSSEKHHSSSVTPTTSPPRGKIHPMPTPLRDLSAIIHETGADLEVLFSEGGRPSKELRDWLARKRCDSAPVPFLKPTPIDQMVAREKKA